MLTVFWNFDGKFFVKVLDKSAGNFNSGYFGGVLSEFKQSVGYSRPLTLHMDNACPHTSKLT